MLSPCFLVRWFLQFDLELVCIQPVYRLVASHTKLKARGRQHGPRECADGENGGGGRMKKSELLLVVLILFVWRPLRAANLPATGEPVVLARSAVALTGPWKFHIGDDPRWADPNYDDSDWETVDLTPRPGVVDPFTGDPSYVPGWTTQGHAGYWGYAWYRIRVAAWPLPERSWRSWRTAVVTDGYQVFAAGTLARQQWRVSRGQITRSSIFLNQPCLCCRPCLFRQHPGRRRRCWRSGCGWDRCGFRIIPSQGECIIRRCWARVVQSQSGTLSNGWNWYSITLSPAF